MTVLTTDRMPGNIRDAKLSAAFQQSVVEVPAGPWVAAILHTFYSRDRERSVKLIVVEIGYTDVAHLAGTL